MDFDQLYTPDMEQAPASSFYKLLRFHHRCQLAIVSTAISSTLSEDSGEAARMSISSLIGIASPFGPIPISLAARYQLHTSEAGEDDTSDRGSCEAVERNLVRLCNEALIHTAEIERVLGSVSIERLSPTAGRK